jgi:hypothetical protein
MMGPDTSGKLAAGLIPVTTLNIDASYAYDEYGRPYTYVVDTGTTVKATCQTMLSQYLRAAVRLPSLITLSPAGVIRNINRVIDLHRKGLVTPSASTR